MIRGVLEELSRNERTRHVTLHYEFLRKVIGDLSRFQILPYDDEAERIFQALPPAVKRIGTKDCRIAASALSRDFTVITRNIDDFEQTGVRCENWIDEPI
jgi:predicted nucleic acid-binding protein